MRLRMATLAARSTGEEEKEVMRNVRRTAEVGRMANGDAVGLTSLLSVDVSWEMIGACIVAGGDADDCCGLLECTYRL
jgi:hypothetical protein